jgi:hypothetical protein
MKRLALVPCVVLLLVLSVRAAEVDTAPVATAMATAADNYLASLNADQLPKAVMDFNDPARRDWHNIPKPERKGIQFRDMSGEQRERCLALIKSALSESGYEKALRIMSLETNLREGEKGQSGTPFRDPERYFLTIFGKPGAAGDWGWSFEGHHFSLNFAIHDGEVVGDSPSFWGANPATVKVFIEGGPEVGARTLANEEQFAFDLLHSFDDAQRKLVVIADKAPDDYRNAGNPEPPREPPVGLAAGHMTKAQQDKFKALLETYLSHLAKPLADRRAEEIKSSNPAAIHFAWWGSTEPGVGHYYRVQGPTFVLELVNIQSDPAGNKANHIHSVWRNLSDDFGVAAK